MNKVSIIIPVFNVEIYLERCIESIINQSYSNLEIILINDGSTDRSLSICNIYKEKDNRIKVIDKQNEGVSSSRNVGLKEATGEYILFVDSDDFIEIDFVSKMLAYISNVDMAICGYIENYKNSKINHKVIKTEQIVNKNSAINLMFDRDSYGGYLWNKIFKSSIIKDNHIKFNTNIHICEDLLFVATYMCKCEKIKIMPDLLYNYRMRESSAVWNRNSKKHETLFVAYNELYELLEKNKISLTNLKYAILNSIYSNKVNKKSIKKYINFNIYKAYICIILSKDINKNRKIKLFLKKNFNYIYSLYMKKKVKQLEMFK